MLEAADRLQPGVGRDGTASRDDGFVGSAESGHGFVGTETFM